MKVIAIAAVGKNGVIGVNAESGMTLPWDIPEDMKFFKDSTRDHIVLMGRKTFQALGKALPKRENAVITRDVNFKAENVSVFQDIRVAIEFYQSKQEFYKDKILFVIGGAEIYSLSLPFLDEIWLTEIDSVFEGNVFFPKFSEGKLHLGNFKFSKKLKEKTDHQSGWNYQFRAYQRIC